MTLTEFEKIVEICYTRKVEIGTRNRKRAVIERELTAIEAAHIIASEFGFNLITEDSKEEDDRK